MVESLIWQHYQSQNPGQVQVLGVDTWNGSPTQLLFFKNSTGTTYPLLLNGGSATGGNVSELYGTWDNYVVIDMRDQTVVYHADLLWPHGNRFHITELRNAIDPIVNDVVAVGEIPGSINPGIQMKAFPNPFRGDIRIELVHSENQPQDGRIVLLNAMGREVATVFEGTVQPGSNRFEWSTGQLSRPLAAGIYLVRATVGDQEIIQRVVYLP